MTDLDKRVTKLEAEGVYTNYKLQVIESKVDNVSTQITNHLKHFSLPTIYLNVLQLLGIIISVLGIIKLISLR